MLSWSGDTRWPYRTSSAKVRQEIKINRIGIRYVRYRGTDNGDHCRVSPMSESHGYRLRDGKPRNFVELDYANQPLL